MNDLQNLHTHSVYCDGKNTLEEMIYNAIKKGFSSIGFSGHSPVPFESVYAMSAQGEKAYRNEARILKRKYSDKINVFCGIELDSYNSSDITDYDYVLGSHHYFKINGEYVGFDRSAECVQDVINNYFNGNGLAFAKAYYEDLSSHPWNTSVDVLAHFDIITKNCEKLNLFDWNSREYQKYAFDAISALKGKIPFFEVNTGAISRGYRTTPYPTLDIMKEFNRQGFGAIITSDCHDFQYIDTGFDLARDMLLEAGFCEKYILTDSGFIAVEL